MTNTCPKCKTDNPDTQKFCGECGTKIFSEDDNLVSQTKTLKTPRIPKGKTVAGKYKILELIGRGGMGEVYRAEDTKLKRTVALKFLPPELTQDEDAKKRFIQEAQAAAALNHPQITTVHEIDEDQGQTFIAMEYIAGQSLKDKLEAGPLKIEEARDIIDQVAEGLLEAHDHGIIHRDIKPANIMLTKRGQAKITDFGLAKLAWGIELTQASTIMGTVAYMSPEQARGDKVDHRTDIWALGAMLYEMLAGVRPFKKEHEQALIYSILNDEPTSISSLRSDVPSDLVKVINKALTKNFHLRYQNIQELKQDLETPSSIVTPDLEKSIAVLPFANMSADPEQEYFCDGMTEEIINALTHISELRVVARTSVFSYKGKDFDIREIGEKLNVGKVLEGSVRKAGDRLRIMVQLINVADGYHIWSERFDRNIGDVFDIQDEITQAILKKLKVKLQKKEKKTLDRQYTDNLEAYTLYLKGRYTLWNIMTPESVKQGIEYYKQALKIQPNYALAYAGLAFSYNGLGWYGVLPPKEAFPKAEKEANKALEIDDSIDEAHLALAYIHNFFHFNWQAAEESCKRALEVNPNSSAAYMQYAWYFISQSQLDDALDRIKRAIELDPLALTTRCQMAMIHYFRREMDEAIAEHLGILALDPNSWPARSFIGREYEYLKQYEKAFKQFQAAYDLAKGTYDLSLLGHVHASAGEKNKAQEILKDLLKQQDQDYVSPMDIARVYMGLGENDQALIWLDKALEDRASWLAYINVDPHFEELKTESRFIEFKKKIGFQE